MGLNPTSDKTSRYHFYQQAALCCGDHFAGVRTIDCAIRLVRATWKRGVDCPVSEDCLTRRSAFEATLLLPGARCRIRERSLSHLIVAASIPRSNRKDGRVVKALDLSSNGRMSAWVRTPLLTRRRVITSTSRLHSVVAIIFAGVRHPRSSVQRGSAVSIALCLKTV